MPNYTETELKLYVPDLAAVAARLGAAGAALITPRVYERNIRYENAAGTLRAERKVVRLRQDTRVRFTYKDEGAASAESGIVSRFEAEVEVSDFDTMHLILGKLGYHPHLIYEKYRTTYTLDGVEIVLDELPYGNFVEIEGESGAIRRVRALLGLEEAPPMGASYAALFEFVRRNLDLPFTDLTFENFRGVSVPFSAFQPPQA